MTSPSIPPIEGKPTVNVPRDQAFDTFTRSFDPAHASEIEVQFHADGPNQTTLEVEHRQFERLVAGESVHGAIRGGGGWPALRESYPRAVAAEEQEARS